MKRAIVTIAVAIAALALTSGAFASSLTSGHGSTPKSSATLGAKVAKKPAKQAVKKAVKKAAAAKPVVKATTLPFTGIDLAAAAFGGTALLGVGFMLRRTSRQNR